MGMVVSLEEYRRRSSAAAAMQRLDVAVRRLDLLVCARQGRLPPAIGRELDVIAHAVSAGSTRGAAERVERLIGILEHPVTSL